MEMQQRDTHLNWFVLQMVTMGKGNFDGYSIAIFVLIGVSSHALNFL